MTSSVRAVLTREQTEAIEIAFAAKGRTVEEARRLAKEWPEIVRMGKARSEAVNPRFTRERVLRIARRLRPTANRIASAAAKAVSAIDRFTAVVGSSKAGLETVLKTEAIEAARHEINRAGSALLEGIDDILAGRTVPPGKRGRSQSVANSVLDVLAAYFRHNNWRVSASKSGLFAEVAQTVLRQKSIGTSRLRRLRTATLDYNELGN